MTDLQLTQYRIYPDGMVVHEDEFEDIDNNSHPCDDYETVSVPNAVILHIVASGLREITCSPPDVVAYIVDSFMT
jgi:hypothetical protein